MCGGSVSPRSARCNGRQDRLRRPARNRLIPLSDGVARVALFGPCSGSSPEEVPRTRAIRARSAGLRIPGPDRLRRCTAPRKAPPDDSSAGAATASCQAPTRRGEAGGSRREGRGCGRAAQRRRPGTEPEGRALPVRGRRSRLSELKLSGAPTPRRNWRTLAYLLGELSDFAGQLAERARKVPDRLSA